MLTLVPSPRTIIPFVTPGQLFSMKPVVLAARELKHSLTVVDPVASVTLPWTPHAPDWVDVYWHGQRIFDYTVSDRVVTFSKPITGFLEFVCPNEAQEPAGSLLIPVKNLQGADAVDTKVRSAQFCRPVVIFRPLNGSARVSWDGKSIAYTPRQGFVGQDTLGFALMAAGQLGKPECVYINVK